MKKLAIIIFSLLITGIIVSADCEEDEENDINEIDPLIFKNAPASLILNPESHDLIITFRAIQRLYRLAAQISKIPGVRDPNRPPLFEGKKEPLPSFNQTEQGIYLIIESYHQALATPWGKIPFYDLHACGMRARIFDEFRQCLQLEFVENSGEQETDNEKLQFYVEQDLEEGDKIEFCKKELDQYRGSNKRIMANYCGRYSLYKVIMAFGISLPEPILLAKPKFRKSSAVQENWNTLMQRYQDGKMKR